MESIRGEAETTAATLSDKRQKGCTSRHIMPQENIIASAQKRRGAITDFASTAPDARLFRYIWKNAKKSSVTTADMDKNATITFKLTTAKIRNVAYPQTRGSATLITFFLFLSFFLFLILSLSLLIHSSCLT